MYNISFLKERKVGIFVSFSAIPFSVLVFDFPFWFIFQTTEVKVIINILP